MKKIKPSDLKGFVNRSHQPYTDHNQEIVDWLRENTDFREPTQEYRYIFSEEDKFYQHFVKYDSDVYYTNEKFKEWIGMTKKVETVQATMMPKLVAGMYVKFEAGTYAQVMDGYFNMVEICREWGAKICGWKDMDERTISSIVEVFQPYTSSGLYVYAEAFNSGEFTIWKKEDERKLRIQQELESAKAKAERLASHIAVLEGKLK